MHVVAIVFAALAAAAAVGWFLAVRCSKQRRDEAESLREKLDKAMAEFARSQSALDTLVASSDSGILLVDERSVIILANEAAIRLLDLARKKFDHVPLADAAISPELTRALEDARKAGEKRSIELRRLGPGSGAVTVTMAPVGDGRWLILADDLTEQRRVESLRRDFVANVSHELRTPMASIRAMAETLRDGGIDDPEIATHFLDTILAEAARLTRIADDLLTLSDAETKPPDLRPVDLHEICVRVARNLRPQAEKTGLTLECNVAEGVTVNADPDQMEQVVVNLVDNAIKYTPSGGSVRLALYCDGHDAVLAVADTGIGILQEHLPRIFERFYRVDKARSRASGGTGLGLSIVKHIVESHGGSIEARSEYTRGSEFIVRLPCLAGE